MTIDYAVSQKCAGDVETKFEPCLQVEERRGIDSMIGLGFYEPESRGALVIIHLREGPREVFDFESDNLEESIVHTVTGRMR